MKRKSLALLTFIVLIIILTSCGKKNNNIGQSQDTMIDKLIKANTVSNSIKPDTVRYLKYINVIDESLEKYNNINYPDIRYGTFSGYYFYSNLSVQGLVEGFSEEPSDYYPNGEIISYFKDENLMGFRMEIGWNTVISYQKGGDYKYQCEKFIIDNDMEYYSYTTNSPDKKEIPSFMCIDGITKVRYSKESQDYTGEYGLESTYRDKEYIKITGVLYEIDRNEETIRKVEDSIAEVYIKWCECEQRDVLAAQKSFHISPEMVEELIPKGYNFSKLDQDYSVADINLDGIDDILVVIYLVQEDSTNREIDEEEYYQLWVLKGAGNGKYTSQMLIDSIVYDDTYTLCDIIATDGGFTMEYFVGRSPFETVLCKFSYDKDREDWFLAAQYQNSSYVTGLLQGLTISGPREYGDQYLSISNDNTYYNVTIQDHINDNYKELFNPDYEFYGDLIQFTNKEITDKIAEIVKQELDKVFATIKNLDEYHDILLQDDSEVFLNKNILVITFSIMDTTEDGTSLDRVIPFCIDMNTGTLINFQDYLTTNEFVKLCKDSNINISNLEELYEHYGDYEYLLKSTSPSITLCMIEEGLVVWETGEYWPETYIITRDKLVDTKLSDFWDDWP